MDITTNAPESFNAAMEMGPKRWTKDDIKAMLQRNPKAVIKALLAIYANQTQDEQATETTRYTNGIGFTGADAEILSSFAQQYIKKNWLSPGQMETLNRRIMKYAGQLARIANGEIAS